MGALGGATGAGGRAKVGAISYSLCSAARASASTAAKKGSAVSGSLQTCSGAGGRGGCDDGPAIDLLRSTSPPPPSSSLLLTVISMPFARDVCSREPGLARS